MRPRHKAAEIVHLPRVSYALHIGASMRPRHKAAEIRPAGRFPCMGQNCFNEAAA